MVLTMEEFRVLVKNCSIEAGILASSISTRLTTNIGLNKNTPFCFRFPLEKRYFLSCSVPLDVMENQCSDEGNFPKTAETLLFMEDEIVYRTEWGYADVKRFHGQDRASENNIVDEIEEEIKRLKSLIEVILD